VKEEKAMYSKPYAIRAAWHTKPPSAMKEEKSRRSQNGYIKGCLQYRELSSLLPAPSYLVTQCHTHLRGPPWARNSSKRRGSEHRGSNESHTKISLAPWPWAPWLQWLLRFHKHRGLERRGTNEFTRNTPEWPPALTYNLSDAPILSRRTHFRIHR
jgi:hypothetical protein